MMQSFEGQFRRRPKVSLRGASRQDDTSVLLQRNLEERRKREAERRKLRSAVLIQSFVRGSLCRLHFKAEQRSQWDTRQKRMIAGKLDAKELLELQRILLSFYDDRSDAQRLTWLCQTLLKQQGIIQELMTRQRIAWMHQTKRLLCLCSNLLQSDTPGNIAMPLRIIEVLTDTSTYTKGGAITEEVATDAILDMYSFLIARGYFSTLRSLVNERLPPGIDTTTKAPMAETVLELVLRPVILASKSEASGNARKIVICALCKELLSPAFTEQISGYLLPAIAASTPGIPVDQLLHALAPANHILEQSVNHLEVESSPWLLHAVMTLVSPVLSTLSPESVLQYLHILKVLLPLLPGLHTMEMMEVDSDDEEEHTMSVTMGDSVSSLSEIREHCIQQLNTPVHVQCLISTATSRGHQSAVLIALCSICHSLMVEHRLHVPRTRLLYTLAFSEYFLRHVWETIKSVSTVGVTGSRKPLIQTLSQGLQISVDDSRRIVPLLSVFCSLFGHLLLSLHDAEFYGDDEGSSHRSLMPFKLPELEEMSLLLRNACIGMIELAHPETRPIITEDYFGAMTAPGEKPDTDQNAEIAKWTHLFKVTALLVKQLHDRDIRRKFCRNTEHWLAKNIPLFVEKARGQRIHQPRLFRPRRLHFMSTNMAAPDEEERPVSTQEARRNTILAEIPFVIPFPDRVKIFHDWIYKDREEMQGNDFGGFLPGRAIDLMIRRNFIYEDAFDRLRPDNEPNLKKKLRVTLKNAQGLDEAGIDGGGICREFLSQLLRTAFDPNRGFFKTTTDELLYPNPHAAVLVENYEDHYYFIGRMLGKVLYENLLVELPFASFFLSKLLSRHLKVDIHHLASLDPLMYKNLLFLKNYDGDISDLALNFTVMDDNLGESKVYELKPGGHNILVTASNRIEYIHLMADFRLNKQIQPHIMAFRNGLADVIHLDWVRMFDHQELQVLVSGASIPIDVSDLRRHTNYSGGYTEDHPVILNFWSAVGDMNEVQKRQLLKFVTSCSRPPLLGFKELYPAFCVHHGGQEEDRLPSASTCMNLLKLPEFHDQETLRSKLLYAIESESGFELS